ncbi:TPA: hypothetical protein RY759_000646 [Staphylococcus aureus]|nr:hypothetical protein [Staphylococcus aureus]HDG8498637.1 hypothetical protein [Staphylococcus aureus]HDG8586004.1 hypothetical protein [Staphylococcus aureus]HDZ3299330.1 hypothetical protein [Staphylococcus aureus]HDZ3316243.1 hypothetical protein [Staphylococcus aureus]
MILTCYNTINTSFAIIEFKPEISGIDEARSK